ncbi:MAG: lysophospholipid acyltransferase family protein [Rickettsiales bacterium]|nr:lysophospholipid acyltransferase family protein [Rickettsiales bacterium]
MTEKKKIFGVETGFEWYDVKTKIKQLLRRITYSGVFQELICLVFIGYMKLVFYTSRKIFVNEQALFSAAKNEVPLIAAAWHNRLMLIPFFVQRSKQLNPNRGIISLASRHGDGQFISKIMQKFGAVPILGSTRDGRKASRGIDVGSFKKLLVGLKKGNVLAITPDGPRGPSQKINGEVVNIARITGAGILPISYSSSRFRKLKTWDQFVVPLPFSTLCFACDETPIFVAKDVSEEEVQEITKRLEERMNVVQKKSQESVYSIS